MFNLSLSQQLFPPSWKQAVIVTITKIRSFLLPNYRLISTLNDFSEVFGFVLGIT